MHHSEGMAARAGWQQSESEAILSSAEEGHGGSQSLDYHKEWMRPEVNEWSVDFPHDCPLSTLPIDMAFG